MSDKEKTKEPTWLAKEFSTEWYFAEKFDNNLSKIFEKMPSNIFLEFIETKNLFEITKGKESNDNSNAKVNVSPYFLMLFGILASTISESMLEVLKESQISSSTKFAEIFDRLIKQSLAINHPQSDTSDNKKCYSCATENRGTARYCDNCGLSF